MSFSYLCVAKMDELDLEFFENGDAIHLRQKSSKYGFCPPEEKRLLMELYEKHGIEVRAQFQHNGFWGTNMRNDYPGQNNMSLPQGLGLYEYNARNGREPSVDTWPRMYTEAWLNS